MDPSQPLQNSRHELFAQAVASGHTLSKAYGMAGYRSQNPDVNSSRVMAESAVSERVSWLKAQNAANCEMTRQDLIRYLCGVLLTPVGNVDEQHRFAQEVKPGAFGTTIKMPGKIDAARLLADICGWKEPERIEHSGEVTLAGEVAAIRAKRPSGRGACNAPGVLEFVPGQPGGDREPK